MLTFFAERVPAGVLFPLFEKVQVAMAVTDRNMDVSTSRSPANVLRCFFSLFPFSSFLGKEQHGQESYVTDCE